MKRSIYASEPIERLIAQYSRGEDQEPLRSVSASLNTAVDRYLEIVRRSMPSFPVNLWGLIFDALNGVWMQEPAGGAMGALKLGIDDAISLDRLDTKWEVDPGLARDYLSPLTYAECVAVIDAAERFWAQPNQGGSLRDEIVAVVSERCVLD